MGSKEPNINRRMRIGSSRRVLTKKRAGNPEAVKRYEARMARLADVRRREPVSARRWCILRTSASRTIELADSLERAGFDVWTPIEVLTKRAPKTRETVERLVAILPTFVFAPFESAGDLFRLSSNMKSDHAEFSVFHHRDRVPCIADRDLAPLRVFEEAAAARRVRMMRRTKQKAEPLDRGQEIKLKAGAFGGLPGTVEESDGRFTLVCFGSMRVKMDTFILRSDAI